MNQKYFQIICIVLVITYSIFIGFVYTAEPKSLSEIPDKAATAIETATSKSQVIIGIYEIDQQKFESGLKDFRADNFISARSYFEQADPEKRDAATQFYIAYSYYRQGWGRFSSDDELYKKGLETLAHLDVINKNYRTDDQSLGLRSSAELKHEMEEGLRVTLDDFNPFRVISERK